MCFAVGGVPAVRGWARSLGAGASAADGRSPQSGTAYRTVTKEVSATVVDPFEECCDRCGRRNVIRQQGGRNRCGDAIRAVDGFVRVENDFRGVAVAAARRIPFSVFRCFADRNRVVVMTTARSFRTNLDNCASARKRRISRPDDHQQVDGQQPAGYGMLRFHRNTVLRCKNSEISVKSELFGSDFFAAHAECVPLYPCSSPST